MKTLSEPITEVIHRQLATDWDEREVLLRRIVGERLDAAPPPAIDDQIVATYFFDLRTQTLSAIAKEIAYHATSGIQSPPSGSLLEQCTATLVGIDAFESSERMGIVHIAFPLKMMQQSDGHVTSCDLLHTLAGAIIFDVFENRDARLVGVQIPEEVIRTFPGPAYGPQGLRELTHFPATKPAFGTILKPTAGITAEDVGRLMLDVAACPLFLFVKEDENLYPNLPYSPVAERTRRAIDAIQRARDQRGGRGLIFAPHLSGAPHEMLDTLHAVIDAGATGVMLSETFSGGTVRMVREATKHMDCPPAIYGHNAGIGVKTHCIWREVVDTLARLDGIDFRQTAPVRSGAPFIRPFGAAWEASEAALSQPLPGIKPVMIARAGALDQGNIGPNMADTDARGISEGVLFLAGSAINSIRNADGRANPRLGAEAMMEAIAVYDSGELRDVPIAEHLPALITVAEQKKLHPLRAALRQRYSL